MVQSWRQCFAPFRPLGKVAAWLLLCGMSGAVFAQGGNTPESVERKVKPNLVDIPYGQHPRHRFDFWKADSDSPTPLAFIVHGGGWTSGDKDRVDRFVDVQQLLDAGISVAAINYRLIKNAQEDGVDPPVKAPLYDAARALQYIRANAERFNIDKKRIGAAGGSAGACTSLWLAFHDDLAIEDSDDPVLRESSRLQCAAVTGAQTTLDPAQMVEWTPNSRYGSHAFGISIDRSQETTAFQQFLNQREKLLPWIQEYSPYALLTKDDPAIALFYGAPPEIGKPAKDPTHTANFGLKLKERTDELGVPCEFVYPKAPGVVHRTATEFLIANLKKDS